MRSFRTVLLSLVVLMLAGCTAIRAWDAATFPDPRKEQARIIAVHPEWPPEMIAAIQRDSIRVGMTREMVRAAWEAPTRISSASDGIEVWLYNRGNFRYQTVTFRDGIVVRHTTNQ